MDPEFSRRYRELYEKHWWFRAREEMIVELLRRTQPAGGWRTILDVGCGDALFFRELQQFGDVEGVEPVAEVVSPDNPYRDRIHVAPFDERFEPEKQYSLILMLDVLEHLDAPAVALRHALSLLEPGGALLITVPAFRLLWTSHDQLNHHRTRYTKSSFRRVAEQAGMRIDIARYAFVWLFPVKLAVRIKESLFGSRPSIPKVPPPAINRLLYWAARMEERLLGALWLPFGSSLLVLGHAAASGAVPAEENRAPAYAAREG